MKFVELHPKPNFRELDMDNPQAIQMKEVFNTAFFGGLRSMAQLNNQHVSELAEYVQKIFDNNLAEFAIGKVPTLTMAIMGHPDGHIVNLVIAPPTWPKECNNDPFHEFGAIVYCCSQVVDSYNQKFDSFEEIERRARGYESEYILSIGKKNWNDYHRQVIEEFPQGIEPCLIYQRKPVELVN